MMKSILLSFAVIVIFSFAASQTEFDCPNTCKLEIVETIPDGMNISKHRTTYDSWVELLELAENTIEIASYYWTLRDENTTHPHPTSEQGVDILERLKEAGTRTEKKIDIRITKEVDGASFPNPDIKELLDAQAAQVRDVNFIRLIGSGILHTKMWIVDRKHLYLGSANLDWRALTQVKEIGIFAKDCSCLAADMAKTFDVYWELGQDNSTIPEQWDDSFKSPYNKSNPIEIQSIDGNQYDAYVSSAPPQFCPEGRTQDLEAIYDVMDQASEFIHIAVMDYFPLIMFNGPLKYWPDLDDYLKGAALNRNVSVKLLMAKWDNTRNSAEQFLRSLDSMNKAYPGVDIQVKMFVVPADEDQQKIPYSRVNHNKYVVTDKSAHLGTSNWSGDYFIATGGVGFIVKPKGNSTTDDIRKQIADVFERDWNSANSKTIDEIYPPTTVPQDCPNGFKNIELNFILMFIISIYDILC